MTKNRLETKRENPDDEIAIIVNKFLERQADEYQKHCLKTISEKIKNVIKIEDFYRMRIEMEGYITGFNNLVSEFEKESKKISCKRKRVAKKIIEVPDVFIRTYLGSPIKGGFPLAGCYKAIKKV